MGRLPVKCDFPKWTPQMQTVKRIRSFDYKTRYQALRNSSSAFIAREDVRNAVMELSGAKCTECGSLNDLAVDHIISVALCAVGQCPIDILNSKDNLTILCRSCHSKKVPGLYAKEKIDFLKGCIGVL